MIQKSKEPRSPVSKERAMEHALLTIRRAWAVHAFFPLFLRVPLPVYRSQPLRWP